MRAAVELAKDWRTNKYLRNLEAMMLVADKSITLAITGNGDVLEPEHGTIAIGSGGNFAYAAARALMDSDKIGRRDRAPGAWISPAISASIPTTISWWKRWMPA